MNISGVALATLLHEEGLLAAPVRPELERPKYDLLPKQPHHPAKTRAMIYLFMQGAPSQIDLFDRKIALERLEGKPYPHELKLNERLVNKLLPSPWKFARYGQSGIEISTLLPHMGSVIDDICVVRSMRTGVQAHGQSIMAMLSGRNLPGRPSLGSWTAYGLGAETQNLPAFVSLPHPPWRSAAWTTGRTAGSRRCIRGRRLVRLSRESSISIRQGSCKANLKIGSLPKSIASIADT